MMNTVYRREPEAGVDDDLGGLVDLVFILLAALLAVLAFFANKDLDHRFAVPYGPSAGTVALSEDDYSREVTVSLDAQKALAVNGKTVSKDQLVDRVAQELAEQSNGTGRVIFDADPTVLHGDAEAIHLLLLEHKFKVLKEYEEIDDEN